VSLQDTDTTDLDAWSDAAKRSRRTRRPKNRGAVGDIAASPPPSEFSVPGQARAYERAPVEVPRGGGAHALAGALRYEWVRLRTLRSTWWLLGAALAVSVVVAWAVARDVEQGNQALDAEAVIPLLTGGAGIAPFSATAVVLGVVGALALGHEYRHGLVRTTLCAVPRRGVALLAKALVVALWAAFVAAGTCAAAYGVGAAVLGQAWTFDLVRDGAVPRALGGFAALVVLTALLGLALAGLFRNLAAALAVLIAVPLALEPVAAVLLESDAMSGAAEAGRYMPFTAAQQMVAVVPDGSSAFVPLGALGGGLVFLGYVAALVLLSAVLLRTRDA
jgi:ABC-2 type transport system permease protein